MVRTPEKILGTMVEPLDNCSGKTRKKLWEKSSGSTWPVLWKRIQGTPWLDGTEAISLENTWLDTISSGYGSSRCRI
jgi:hypothetical protein